MGRRLTKFLYRSKGSTQRRGEKQCLDCGEWKPPRDFYVKNERGDTLSYSIDHIMPLARGGKHAADNLAVACLRCNAGKRDRTQQEIGLLF